MKDSGNEILRPRARMLRTLGDELISSETVAIIELVKNSYDADATKVIVRFSPPITKGEGVIEIIDNGHGMSLETIRTSWMEPATHHKRKQRHSERFRRRLLGEKGIGRFAASRLADELEVITRRKSANEVVALFDWKQFDDEQKYLDEIEVLWEEKAPDEISLQGIWGDLFASGTSLLNENQISGTILRMKGLRFDWKTQQFETLREGLSRLISPFYDSGKNPSFNNFEIVLLLPPDFQHLSGAVAPPDTLRNPPYSISGYIREDGSHRLKIKLKDSEEYIRGRFTLRNEGGPELQCGPFFIELRVWNRDTESIREIAELRSSTLKSIRDDLDKASGVSIYRDKFRVLPYGEPKNDWLRLDIRRVQNPTLRISNNQIVGYVLISADKNPLLVDQSNREGLMEGPAFDDFREVITHVLNELEQRRYSDRRSPAPPDRESSGGLFSDFNLESVRDIVKSRHPEDKVLLEAIDEKEKFIAEKVVAVQNVLGRYRRLSSLGQLIDTVLHDTRAPLAKIVNEADIALKNLERGTLDTSEKIEERFNKVRTQAHLVERVFQKIEPLSGRRTGKATKCLLEAVIKDTFSIFDEEIKNKHISVRLPYRETTIRAVISEIQQVILNLLQNSIHWLEKVPADERHIFVEVISKNTGQAEIVFSDSGPGIPEHLSETVFEPYFSTKANGIGLGLAIAGEIVQENYRGRLELIDGGPLGGATFRITLNDRE